MAGFNPFAALYSGLKIRKGPAPVSARTPGTFGGKLYQPPPDPGNTFTPTPNAGYNPDEQRYHDLVANPLGCDRSACSCAPRC